MAPVFIISELQLSHWHPQIWAQLIPCSISTLVLKLNYSVGGGGAKKCLSFPLKPFFILANIFFGHTFCLANQWKVQIPIFVAQYATFCMLVFIFVILLVSKRQRGATKVMIYWELCKGKHSAKRNSATKKCLKMETFVKCQCAISTTASSCWNAAIWTSEFSFPFRFHKSAGSPAV